MIREEQWKVSNMPGSWALWVEKVEVDHQAEDANIDRRVGLDDKKVSTEGGVLESKAFDLEDGLGEGLGHGQWLPQLHDPVHCKAFGMVAIPT